MEKQSRTHLSTSAILSFLEAGVRDPNSFTCCPTATLPHPAGRGAGATSKQTGITLFRSRSGSMAGRTEFPHAKWVLGSRSESSFSFSANSILLPLLTHLPKVSGFRFRHQPPTAEDRCRAQRIPCAAIRVPASRIWERYPLRLPRESTLLTLPSAHDFSNSAA